MAVGRENEVRWSVVINLGRNGPVDRLLVSRAVRLLED